MQIITVSGRLGKDAETRDVNGNQVTSFNIAVDQGYGQNKTSNWFRVSVWGKKGSGAAPYLLKGSSITVVGSLEIGEYNGAPQYNINASDFTLPAKGPGGGQASQRQQSRPTPQGAAWGDDDLDSDAPF